MLLQDALHPAQRALFGALRIDFHQYHCFRAEEQVQWQHKRRLRAARLALHHQHVLFCLAPHPNIVLEEAGRVVCQVQDGKLQLSPGARMHYCDVVSRDVAKYVQQVRVRTG